MDEDHCQRTGHYFEQLEFYINKIPSRDEPIKGIPNHRFTDDVDETTVPTHTALIDLVNRCAVYKFKYPQLCKIIAHFLHESEYLDYDDENQDEPIDVNQINAYVCKFFRHLKEDCMGRISRQRLKIVKSIMQARIDYCFVTAYHPEITKDTKKLEEAMMPFYCDRIQRPILALRDACGSFVFPDVVSSIVAQYAAVSADK